MAESPVVAADGGAVLAGGGVGPVAQGDAGDQGADVAGAGGATRAPRLRLGRRRQANVAGGRTHTIKVTVTEVEAALLTDLAREAGVSVPRLLVEAALAAGTGAQTSTQRHEAMVELFAVHRVLSGIAVNINQVAKATNATREAPEAGGWTAALAAVRKAAFRIDDVLVMIGNEQRAAGRRR